ncbi:MAG: hypothetical protein PHN44_06480 [Candidatus Marinimicrobia bacterium]|jgi:hypothetical protein|nr:hypothetical protein [Candidatus Neomarinimicrobiota bacterium]MDD5539861.1 hypothetical protein [Candidatus Neomarinimicrobiota bacterium]
MEFFTWIGLGTFAGASAATLLIVQYFKGVIPKAIDTRLFAWIVALIILLCVVAFTDRNNLSAYGIAVLNSVLVATSAMGGYEVTFQRLEKMNSNK